MREIPLTKGYVSIVDDEDYEEASRFSWHAVVDTNTVYAIRTVRTGDGKRTTQSLHRFIMGVTDPDIEVDHIDRNGLNNQKYNLRPCTHVNNVTRRQPERSSKSGLKGVSRLPSGRYRATIQVGAIRRHIGVYDTPKEAGMAYDREARSHSEEFAYLNFPVDKP